MNQKLRCFRQRAAVAWLVPLLCACGSDTDFNYAPPTDAQLQEIEAIWRERDLSPRGIALVFQSDDDANYQLRIYEHVVEGRKHYGAVTIPKSDAQPAFPVVLAADGLNQFDPRMDVSGWIRATRPLLDRAVFVVPAFRGRTLTYDELTSDAESDFYRELTFAAEGDFCDAYDGATDDSIALLNVVADQVPRADFTRLLAEGSSRGGNVALLVAERDERVVVVSARSAPTDFYRQEVADHYGEQYRCQFRTGKTEEQSRQRMLSSSPLRFLLKPGVRKVYVDHGEQDATVPLWNALEMVSRIEQQPVDVQFHSYPGYGHTDLGASPDFHAMQEEMHESFLGR